MKIKKISGSEVTVYLTSQDLDYFDFNPNKAPEEGDLHKFLFKLMELVQNETGFDPYNDGQVVVEAVNYSEGMRLNISKINNKKSAKITREQFNNAKVIKVKECSEGISSLSKEDLIWLLDSIGIDKEKSVASKHRKETFIFESFASLEGALCHLDNNLLKGCILYRSGARYAITANLKRGGRTYNILSEFAEISRSSEILAADIGEGWLEIARGNRLFKMADAVRAMH